jgi:hypothetical protein
MKASKWLAALCAIIVAFLFLLHPVFTAEQPNTPPAPKTPADNPSGGQNATPEELQKRIADLIKQLGVDQWQKREDAQKALADIGEPARKQLEEAKNSTDQEVVQRASQLLEELALADVTLLATDKHGKPITKVKIDVIVGLGSIRGLAYMGRSDVAVQSATLGDSGAIRLKKVNPGVYGIVATAEGYVTEYLLTRFVAGAQTRRIVFHKGGAIKGKVVDIKNGNKPVKGVTIVLSRGTRTPQGQTATTDDNGEFTLECVAEGAAKAVLPDQRVHCVNPDDGLVNVIDEKVNEILLKVTQVTESCGTVKFRVVGTDGAPAKGMVILQYVKSRSNYMSTDEMRMIEGRDGYSGAGAQIGPNGEVQFQRLRPGKWDVIIWVKGYAVYKLEDIDIKSDEITELPDVRLSKSVPLKIKVVDARGQIVSGVTVMTVDVSDPTVVKRMQELQYYSRYNMPGDTQRADGAGVAVFEGKAAGKYAVRAYEYRYGVSNEIIVETRDGDGSPVYEVKFERAIMLQVRAVDRDTGEEIKNARLMLSNAARSGPATGGTEEHIIVDDSATWWQSGNVIQGVRFGTSVHVIAPGYKPASCTADKLGDGAMNPVTVRMEKPAKGDLKITIVPAKGMTLDDIGGVWVRNNNAPPKQTAPNAEPPSPFGEEMHSLDKGVFEMQGVLEGPCYISVVDKDRRLMAMFRTDAEKGKLNQVTLNMPAVGKIEGTLLDDEGNSMPSVAVFLVPVETASLLSNSYVYTSMQDGLYPIAITDSDGKFSFDKVPEGTYALVTLRDNGITTVTRFVKVDAGGTAKANLVWGKPLDVTLTLKTPPGEKIPENLQLQVLPLPDDPLRLVLMPVSMDLPLQIADVTTRLCGVYEGKYRCISAMPGNPWSGAWGTMEITAAKKDVEMVMSFRRGGRCVSGRFTKSQGTLPGTTERGMVFIAGPQCFTAVRIMPDGSFKAGGLQPGKYRIYTLCDDAMCCNADDYVPEKEIVIEEGKDLEGLTIP